MKQYKFLVVLFALAMLLSSCEDTFENRVVSRGVAVVPFISDINPAFYTTDFASTFVQFKVALPEGDTVDAAELQVTYQGKTEVLQNITAFPVTLTLPAADVLAIFDLEESDVKVDDFFLYQVVTTSGGVITRSPASLKVFVTCEFDPILSEGSYHVVAAKYAEGDVILTADPDNPYLIGITGLFEMQGGEPNDNVLYLNINPNNFSVTGKKTILGPTAPDGQYADFSYTPTSGLYKSCTGTFEMTFDVNVDIGGWGNKKFIFTKN